jgi:2-methylisocitrate lyase-like PEP mutase family enzyme
MNAYTKIPAKTSTQLRRMLSSPGLIKGVNIYDPLTARIAEEVGFRFIASVMRDGTSLDHDGSD